MKSKKNDTRIRVVLSTIFGIVLYAAAAVSFASERSAGSQTPLPSSMFGTWQVTAVYVDRGATRTLRYQNNDLRLIGRIFAIQPDQLVTNTPEEKKCVSPTVATKIKNVARLVEESMAGRGIKPQAPSLYDYAIHIPNPASKEAFTVNCDNGVLAGSLGKVGSVKGAWIVSLPGNKLAVRWYDETILLLSRVSDIATPIASYQCSEAATTVESKICKSFALAAFDRSVADAYTGATKQLRRSNNAEVLNRLITQQKTWLKKRDLCGTDDSCLEKSMSERLEEIDVLRREE